MSAIAAIETTFKGVRFRSRLEARWAMFFTGIDVEWQYEPEGFRVDGDGTGYAPDFLLTNVSVFDEKSDCFLEIKPSRNAPGIEKCFAFNRAGALPIFIAFGPPRWEDKWCPWFVPDLARPVATDDPSGDVLWDEICFGWDSALACYGFHTSALSSAESVERIAFGEFDDVIERVNSDPVAKLIRSASAAYGHRFWEPAR